MDNDSGTEDALHAPLIDRESGKPCNKKLCCLSTLSISLFVTTIAVALVIVNSLSSAIVFSSCEDYESFALKKSMKVKYVVFTKTFNCTKLIFPENSFYHASVLIAGMHVCGTRMRR